VVPEVDGITNDDGLGILGEDPTTGVVVEGGANVESIAAAVVP